MTRLEYAPNHKSYDQRRKKCDLEIDHLLKAFEFCQKKEIARNKCLVSLDLRDRVRPIPHVPMDFIWMTGRDTVPKTADPDLSRFKAPASRIVLRV